MTLRMKKKLFLFTNSFPFDHQYTEIAFLKNEVSVLKDLFDLHILPLRASGERIDLDPEVSVNTGLSQELQKRETVRNRIQSVFKFPLFFKELLKCRTTSDISHLLKQTSSIVSLADWCQDNQENLRIDNSAVFYSYWNTFAVSGISLFKKRTGSKSILIARAHGADLYLERKRLFPYYERRLSDLTALVLVSKFGYDYISRKFPRFIRKYHCIYLGTIRTELPKAMKSNEFVTIASCSSINKLKRVELILHSMIDLADRYSGTRFHWYHIGGGDGLSALKEEAYSKIPENLEIEFMGVQKTEAVHRFYKNYFIDVFVHASVSEGGIGIAIAEAMSYGIPIVSTPAGGIPEIINAENGILVDLNPEPREFSEAIASILFDDKRRAHLSNGAVDFWEKNLQAKDNFNRFGKLILKLAEDHA